MYTLLLNAQLLVLTEYFKTVVLLLLLKQNICVPLPCQIDLSWFLRFYIREKISQHVCMGKSQPKASYDPYKIEINYLFLLSICCPVFTMSVWISNNETFLLLHDSYVNGWSSLKCPMIHDRITTVKPTTSVTWCFLICVHFGLSCVSYSTVCKPRSPRAADPPPAFSSSSLLGGGLSELDHLLQELNATQFNITG